MKMSETGYSLTKVSEGLVLHAYQDGGGVWTIGYGHTAGVRPGQVITKEQADAFLHADMAASEALVSRLAPSLPQLAFDALCDFAFNLGQQGFFNHDGAPTGLKRALDAKRFTDVPGELRKWIYDNHKVQKGLVTRRDAECALWDRGFAQ